MNMVAKIKQIKPMTKGRKALREDVLNMIPLIAELRKEGKEYREIADIISARTGSSVSHVTVWKIFTEALQLKATDSINNFRQYLLENYLFELDRLEAQMVKSEGIKRRKVVKTSVAPEKGKKGDKKEVQPNTTVEVSEWEEGLNVTYLNAKLRIFSDIRTMLGIDEPVKKETMGGGGGGSSTQTRISILALPSNGREVVNLPVAIAIEKTTTDEQ
jgi:hypothetical protein